MPVYRLTIGVHVHISCNNSIVTLPAGAVAKYCDEYVRLCSVCLSARQDRPISGTTRAIFTKFLCLFPMSVAWSPSGMLTVGRIACRRKRVTGVHSAGEV